MYQQWVEMVSASDALIVMTVRTVVTAEAVEAARVAPDALVAPTALTAMTVVIATAAPTALTAMAAEIAETAITDPISATKIAAIINSRGQLAMSWTASHNTLDPRTIGRIFALATIQTDHIAHVTEAPHKSRAS